MNDVLKNPLSLFDVRGKVAIVVGASGSFGSLAAKVLAGAGAKVVLVAGGKKALDEVAGECRGLGAEVEVIAKRAESAKVCEEVVAAAVARFGRLDILVVGSGKNIVSKIVDMQPEQFLDVMDVNVTQSWLMARAGGAQMLKQGEGGKVILMSSARGLLGHPAGYTAYCASKSAIDGITKALGCEWGAAASRSTPSRRRFSARRSPPGCSRTTSGRTRCAKASSPACRKAASASRRISPVRSSSSPRRHRISTPAISSTPTAATPRGNGMAERIGIVGAGLMGHGIAQVFALHGHEVAVYDAVPEALATLRQRIERNLADLGQDTAAASRVTGVATLAEAVGDADIVIEAALEKLELKQEIFAELEKLAPRHALLASNTSVIPIGLIAARVASKDRVLGTHWWNPPWLVPLVEVIETEGTAPESVAAMMTLLRALGKTVVHVRKDVPGFIGNRLQHALWREAIALVQNGVCDAETVDTVVKAGFGRRLAVLGPLENADLVGTDLTLDIHRTVLPDLDRTPGPLPYLKALVAAGRLGFKSGEGFRRWTPEEQAAIRARVTAHLKKAAAESPA